METLKIALVTDWFLPRLGGVEVHVHELASTLSKRGHEVHVITPNTYGKGLDAPYHIHRIPAERNAFFFNVLSRKGMLAVHHILKWEAFDVVHGHSFFAPLSLFAVNDASGILGIPSIITVHSIPELHSMRFLNAALLRKVLQKVTAFIAVSTVVEKYLADVLDWTRWGRPIWVIPNGIDLKVWKPAKREKRETLRERLGMNGPTVVTVSRLAVRKRVTAVPKIAERVVREVPDANFVVVGDGVQRRAIELEIRRRKVKKNVMLTGGLPRERVADYLRAADAYLDPTKVEALGIALLEAQACGVPGVGYAGSGVVDILNHGENGYLYWDDEEAAEYIVDLLWDDALRRRMGKNARRIAERFSWDRVGREVEKAYKKTIERYEYVPYRAYDIYKRWLKRSPLPSMWNRTALRSLPPKGA